MSEHAGELRIHPGDGVLMARDHLVVLAAPGPVPVATLLELLEEAPAEESGAATAAWADEVRAAGVAGVALARRQPTGTWSLRRWGLTTITGPSGIADAADGVAVVVHGSHPWSALLAPSAGSEPTPWSALREGVLPASGVSWEPVADRAEVPGAPASAPAPPTPPVAPAHAGSVDDAPTRLTEAPVPAAADPDAPAAAGRVDLVNLDSGELRPPLPRITPEPPAVEVRGIHCRNGHLNHPDGRLCYLCGDNLQNQSITIAPDGAVGALGPRPPLGVVTLDDGCVFQLSSDLLIGRDPAAAPGEHVSLAPVLDDTVSRTHLRLHLVDWEVLVEDLGSANGTRLLVPGTTAYVTIPSRTRVPLTSGTVLAFGRRWATFEATAAAPPRRAGP